MVRQIYESIPERLTDSYYGKKIMAAYLSYGAGYDFCRFYACEDTDGKVGTIHVYYAAMVIDGNVSHQDAETFINMIKPMTVEVSGETALQLPDEYQRHHRTLFRLKQGDTDIDFHRVKKNNCMAESYIVLKESFENMGDFDKWYVDISHRIRHGVAELYLYEKTTVTKSFDIDGYVFLSHIATARSERGKGTARRLLRCLAKKYNNEGREAYLFARDHRKSFYESIGFEPVKEDILYEIVE
ncbi:MAG: GNAT family N-acetyltransferase [Oscillospiraceae bacterium]|nr:GNAT family N-acetyltransferase [Oscillospiraceae bacterium]